MTNEKELTHIDLFSGIGGFTLAGEWAGFKTIVFCEKEKFCQKVLKKHWPEIPIIEEIRDFDGAKYRGATLLTGGFPCQPFSVAGQQRGKEDDRYLWPEMLRIIKEAKPRWILAENVTGIIKLALGQVLSDLEGVGYDFPKDHGGTPIVPVIPACGYNAPHRRYRIWIVGYSTSDGYSRGREEARREKREGEQGGMRKSKRTSSHAQDTIEKGTRDQTRETDNQGRRISQNRREGIRQKDGEVSTGGIASTDKYASDSKCLGRQEGARNRIEHEKQVSKRQNIGDGNSERVDSNSTGQFGRTEQRPQQSKRNASRETARNAWQIPWHEAATRFCRVDDGVSDRVHRLKALGNAIVPQIAYEILKNIAWIEKEES